MNRFSAFFFAAFAASALASEPASGVEGAEDVPAPPARPAPGRSDRPMTPEMREYVAKLEKIRLERDGFARSAIQAEKDIKARKEAIAGENEDVKALVEKAAELRAALEETEKALDEAWDADERIVLLRKTREDSEAARAAKNRELQFAVQTAMRARSGRPGEDGIPDIRTIDTAKKEEAENKPRMTIGGKDAAEFLAGLPATTNLQIRVPNGRALMAPPPAADRQAE